MTDTQDIQATRDAKTARVAVGSTDLFAFDVEVNSLSCVVFAATAAKARWRAVKAYWEAGYGRGRGNWPAGVKATRAPHLDRCPLRNRFPQRAWSPEYVRELT